MAAYRRVYDSRHLQANCQEFVSAPGPYTLGNRVWATFFTHYPCSRPTNTARELGKCLYIQGDSDVISMLAGFRRHLAGKTLINVFHCDINETRFVGKLMIIRTFS